MKIEMNDEGGIDLVNLHVDQISLLVQSLQDSPDQRFMEDAELNNMIKLLSILQSEVFTNASSGKIDLTQFKIS